LIEDIEQRGDVARQAPQQVFRSFRRQLQTALRGS
jgi:hypothetical protein